MTTSSPSRGPKMRSLLAMIGVAGLAVIGSTFMPSANATVTLGDTHDTPGSIILGGLSSMVPKPPSLMDQYLVPGTANITNIGVEVNSPTRFIVHAGASLKNPFGPVALPLGQVGLTVSLDGNSLANITTSDLTLPAGTGPINVTATVDIADGSTNPAVQASLNNLVTSLVGGTTPSGEPPKLVISGVKLSGIDLGVAPITVPTQLKPNGPIQPTNVTADTATPPVVGFNDIINPNVTFAWPVLQKIVVKAVSGAQLTAGVGFSWNNPLNIAVDIPYISIDIGLNGTRVVTVGIEAIHLAPGNMTADTLVDLKFNNDPLASAQLGAFVNDFLAGQLNQVVNIGNLSFGTPGDVSATGQMLNTLFSGVNVDLPLNGVSTVAIQELVLSYIKPYLPIDISKLGGTGASLLSYIQSLAISTAPGHTLLIDPKIQLPFPFLLDLNIPYFALDINLDNNLLGQLFLANLVGTGQGQISVSVGVGIVFKEPSPQIPAIVAKLVSGLTTGSSLDITAGVSNLAIGVSPADAINTLNNVNVAVPISSVITGHIETGNLIQSIIAQTNVTIASNTVEVKVGTLAALTIRQASISVLPSNMVTAGVTLDMFLGIPVVANIGYFGVQLSLDGAQLAGVSMNTGLNYGGGTVQMDAGIAISVGTGPAISTNVANLVNAIIAKSPVNSNIGISGIVIGQSSTDLINALSGVSVSLPLGGLVSGVTPPSLPSNFLNSTLAQLGLSVSNISLATIPNAGLRVGAKAMFSNPIPISLSVPYIGISGGLDNIDILNIGVDNLALLSGANALQAQIDLNFNNAVNAQTKVATLLGELLGGQLGNTPEALTVHNLRIGSSPSDYFDLLSQVNIAVPSKDILSKANADLLIGQLGVNITQLTNNVLSGLQIGAINADLTTAPVIQLGTSVSVSNVSLSAAVNIGYFGIDLALDTHALAHVDVPSISITTANNKLTLAIQAAVTIQDSPQIQTDIANLVDYFMANTTTSPVNNLVISKPLVGASVADNIQTFALIQYPLALSPLLANARVFVNQLLAGVAGGLNLNNLAISGLTLDLNAPPVINVQGGVQIKNLTLPADIKISYVGVSLGLDNTPLASLTIPTLALTSANNTLSLNFQALVNLQQGPDLSAQIGNLVGSLLYPGKVTPPTALVISNPVFGGDANHLFHILSQIKVNVALAPYLQAISGIVNGTVSNSGNLLAGLDIGSLVVDLNSPQNIGIDAAISLKNITIPAEIKLNYVGVNVAIDTVGLAQISVPSFTLKPADGALAITAHVDVALLTSDGLTTAISNLITGVLNNQTTPATNIVISGAVFGGSANNVFTILQGIAIPINIAPYINMIPALLAGQGSLLSRVAIGALVVDLNTPQTIGVDTSVSIKNVTLPAQIKLNYVSANVAIGEVPLVQLGIPQFTMTPNNGNLDIALHINLAMQESTGLTQTINGLAQAVLAGQQLPSTTLVISGAAFGGSPTSVFTFLQGVKIPLDVTAYLNKALGMVNVPGASSLLSSIGISDLVVDLNSPQVIGIDASVLVKNVTLPAQIKLNYVGANVAINSIPLAQVAIPTFTLAPQGNDLALKVHINLALLSSPELSSAISGLIGGILGNQTLPQTNLVLSGAAFGASSTNYFTFLQGVVIPVNISPYITQIAGMAGGAGSILNGLGLSGLAINLNQAPVIGIDANIAVRNLTLPAKLNVGYFGLNVGINNVPLVNVAIPKLELGSSGSDLTIGTHIDATLQETDASQTLVAGLVNEVVAGRAPQGTIVISGITFGPSKSSVFTILQGVQIPIPISKILSLVPATPGTNATSILNNLSLQSADINMKNPPSIGADIAIALLGYQFDAQLLLSYVSISAFLDTTPLATISVPGITLSSGNNQVSLSVRSLVNLASGDAIQTKVAAIAAQVMGNGGAQNANLVVSNIAFGGNAGNVFHILDKVQVSVPLAPYIQQLTGIVGGITGGNSTIPGGASAFSISQLDISATGPNDLSVAVGAAIGGLGSKISVEMPYVGLQISASGNGLVYPTINNFQLQNGKVSLTLALPFQPAARNIIAGLSTPVSQLMFTTVGTVPGSIVANSIKFGASSNQAFDIASKIGLEIQLNSVFQAAQAYINAHNPLHINDMNTVLTTSGIQATLALPGIPLGSIPLKMNFPISLSGYYQSKAFIAIQVTGMSLTQSPWSLGAGITVIQPAFGTAMNGILPNALEWKNALQDVTLGGVTLGEFTALQGLTITPPAVTLWSPITVPLGQLKPHLIPLGMDFAASFVNQGPLQVDVGAIDIMIKQGPNTNVLEIQNLGGPIHLNNGKQNGGNNQIALNASLKFNFLQFFTIIAALLNPSQNFQFVFSMKTSSGQPMPWLQDALNSVPATLFNNLLPILAHALQNVKFGI
ncbi:hypothetical protein BC939DRAFT_498765 [Gamsiella multidivaricata]|uniref:uncharacterized protein n=1 Tax=Gamsiella multidivaricata TaxID=101098 RepID=UPI00221ED46E|nr:uncharacterized protein BC939DRAFT_498765 [Gamsiella multidivaricata]KAG0361268.1 hypothetical protein BGZ54_009157 [Gamsiella multidivaricata]KAI7831801.1 hypothetical protein BC939DRAFT_498765 [Gamsiella multidivaricata]